MIFSLESSITSLNSIAPLCSHHIPILLLTFLLLRLDCWTLLGKIKHNCTERLPLQIYVFQSNLALKFALKSYFLQLSFIPVVSLAELVSYPWDHSSPALTPAPSPTISACSQLKSLPPTSLRKWKLVCVASQTNPQRTIKAKAEIHSQFLSLPQLAAVIYQV